MVRALTLPPVRRPAAEGEALVHGGFGVAPPESTGYSFGLPRRPPGLFAVAPAPLVGTKGEHESGRRFPP